MSKEERLGYQQAHEKIFLHYMKDDNLSAEALTVIAGILTYLDEKGWDCGK